MKTPVAVKTNSALTMIEVLMVLAVLMIFAAFFFSVVTLPRGRTRAPRIQCVNNLKQCALATRVWEGDNNDKYPPQVPGTNGGTMDFITGPNAWRHFQVMSNELSTPKVVFCPAESDRNRFTAPNFVNFGNSNISFFDGVDASESNPQMILYGDHNITNGIPVRNGLLELTTNHLAGWTSEMHNKVGNVALSDGSVQQISIVGLQSTIASTGFATNRLQMPVLGP